MELDFNKYPLPKRLRHHTASNLYFKLAEMKEDPGYYPPLINGIKWEDIFLNSRKPDMIDIGCGKGIFLMKMAYSNPNKNILGIEVRKQVTDWINGVITGENILNCAVIWYSIVNGMDFIESGSIEKVFYLFPDPWPKRKHLKRRAFNTDFLSEIHRVLTKYGKLYLATDVPEVHEYHIKVIKKLPEFKINIVLNDLEWQLPTTNKENFCRKENIPFFRLIVENY